MADELTADKLAENELNELKEAAREEAEKFRHKLGEWIWDDACKLWCAKCKNSGCEKSAWVRKADMTYGGTAVLPQFNKANALLE